MSAWLTLRSHWVRQNPPASYLNIDKIVQAAIAGAADAVHTGYGFLAESPALALALEQKGIALIGPSADAIAVMGDKVRARVAAGQAGVPVIPAAQLTSEEATDLRAAEDLGFPVLVKAAAGGGGRGMRRVDEPSALTAAVRGAAREAETAFGDPRVYLEKCIEGARQLRSRSSATDRAAPSTWVNVNVPCNADTRRSLRNRPPPQ